MFQSRDDGSKSNLHLVFLVLIEFLKRLICKKRLALTTLHPPPLPPGSISTSASTIRLHILVMIYFISKEILNMNHIFTYLN
jgi:hypothetical protein